MIKHRVIWVAVLRLASLPALWATLNAVSELVTTDKAVGGLIVAFPWVALGVMVAGWVRDVRVCRFWPIVGTLIAAPLALPAMLISFWFFIPGFVLAIWQVQFHLEIGAYANREQP